MFVVGEGDFLGYLGDIGVVVVEDIYVELVVDFDLFEFFWC